MAAMWKGHIFLSDLTKVTFLHEMQTHFEKVQMIYI